jgi:tetratricopeptide (TPR) repeat protein
VEQRDASGSFNTQDAVNSAAVQLFIQQATQVQPTFVASDAALTSIVHICQQVSGIPLAIELAAAGVRILAVAEIEQQIRANLDVLSANFFDSPMRQRSLRATFDYSWALLTKAEGSLLTRLAVFRGGCTADAAQAVAGASISSLQSLIDKSLLHQSNASETSTTQRFFLLEPTREYALERLEAVGEGDKLRHDHAMYYLDFAEAVTAQWASLKLDSVLEKLEQEHNNMRAALQWARDTGSSLLGLQLGGALWRFWRSGGYVHEARLWLDELLALDDGNIDPAAVSARQRVILGAAWLAADQGDWERAGPLFEQSITLLSVLGESQDKTILVVGLALQTRAKGDYRGAVALLEDLVTRQRRLIASGNFMDKTLRPAHYCRALMAREQGDYTYADTLFQEGIDYHRMIGDDESVAQGELGVSDVARDTGDVTRLRAYAEQSLATYRELGIEWAIGFAMNNLALAAYLEGDLPKAFEYSSKAVLLFRGIQNKLSLAEVLITMGQILAGQGKTMSAREAFVEALRFASSLGPRIFIAGALEGLAQVTLEAGDAAEAIKFISGAATIRAQMGTPVRPIDLPRIEQTLSNARKILGEETFVHNWSAAQTQPLEQLLSVILNE